MKRASLVLSSLLLLTAAGAQAQTLDPYFGLPGAQRELGLALLPATTPDLTDLGGLSTTDVIARYSVDGRLEVGGRATFGFLHDGADSFSSVTLGARYAWQPGYAVTASLTPYNEVEEIGLSLGGLAAFQFPEFDLDTQLQLGLLDAYAPVGAAVHLLVRPSRVVHPRAKAFLDVDVISNTDDLGKNLSVLVGPNVAVDLSPGWRLRVGTFFSAMSGDLVADDTEMGLRLGVQRTLTVR